MINYDIVKECLDILELKYTELEHGGIAVSFFDEEFFPYQIVTFINVNDDENFLSFSSRSFDYKPQGDLEMMANRHNCRCHMPCCHISDNGDVVMDRGFNINAEVSPLYILNDIIRPSIFLPLESFVNFEKADDELE